MARFDALLATRKIRRCRPDDLARVLPVGRSTMAMLITRMRAVCTLGETIPPLELTIALTSADLPAFGAGTMA